MREQLPSMHSAIDIGSNTIHITIANCTTEKLDVVADEQEHIGIGESVTTTGEISAEKRDASISALRRYQKLALRYGATPILVVATEAIRRARNNADFLKLIQRETGLHVHLISGTTEAALSFLAATYEDAMAQNRAIQLGVMDLGGGSLELTMARDRKNTWCTSIPLGSSWLHDQYLPSDPPTRSELAAAKTFLKKYFHDRQIRYQPSKLIVIGGSARAILQLTRHSFKLGTQSNRLTTDNLLGCEGILRTLTAEQVCQRYEQTLDRARILPAGLIIIQVMMDYLCLQEIYVSGHSIREGTLLAYKRYGEDWPECIGKACFKST